MAVNLTIDQGNSAAKLALWNNEQLVDLMIVDALTPGKLNTFILNNKMKVNAAIYCSVASRGQEVMQWLKNHTGKVMRLTNQTPVPLQIDYLTPQTLGADRLAACVGAWHLAPDTELLVVDAGTAVTYDHVSADGHFLGGNIAPGMSMRLEALHRFTARLPRVEVPRNLEGTSLFGQDTASAMISGAVFGIVGTISYYRSCLPETAKVVLTGGWAPELSQICQFPTIVDQNLVSRGLNRILIYNENN